MGKRKQFKIRQALDNLQRDDVTSLLLFALYKMRDVPEYSALSELAYVLDGRNLSKLMTYYGGMTIKIPTNREFRLMIEALTLYEYVNVEGGDLDEGLIAACGTEFKSEDMLKAYLKICEVAGELDFTRGEV